MSTEPEDEDQEFQELLDMQSANPNPTESKVDTLESQNEKVDWRIRLTVWLSVLIIISMCILTYVILNPPGNGVPEPTTSP